LHRIFVFTYCKYPRFLFSSIFFSYLLKFVFKKKKLKALQWSHFFETNSVSFSKIQKMGKFGFLEADLARFFPSQWKPSQWNRIIYNNTSSSNIQSQLDIEAPNEGRVSVCILKIISCLPATRFFQTSNSFFSKI